MAKQPNASAKHGIWTVTLSSAIAETWVAFTSLILCSMQPSYLRRSGRFDLFLLAEGPAIENFSRVFKAVS